jgi:hypothetical protein
MRTFLFACVVVAGCSKNSPAPQPANTAPAASGPTWQPHAMSFMTKFFDVLAAGNGDCDKLAAGLEGMSAEATSLHAELAAANKTMNDITPDDAFKAHAEQAMKGVDPSYLDTCGKQPRVKKALDQSLFVVFPITDDKEFVSAFADAFGKAMAPH